MSRLPMPGSMPAELAERLSDRHDDLPVDDYKSQAREELIERLLFEGQTVGRFHFTDILDAELDSSWHSTLDDLQAQLLSIIAYARDEHCHCERRSALEKWMHGMVERFIDSRPDLIEDRAAELAAGRTNEHLR